MGLSTVDVFKHLPTSEASVVLDGERLESLQRVLTMMLEDVDSICREFEIDYVLGGGNCIGAVRHSGFIPWDDDVDIDMTREGFELFEQRFLDRFGDKYAVQTPSKTEGYGLGFPRIRLKQTVLKSREDFETKENGVYIDIFILENAPATVPARAIHGVISLGLGFALSCRRFEKYKNSYIALASENKRIERTFKAKAALGKLFSFASVDAWCRAWDRWNSAIRNNASEYVVCPVGRKHYFGELWKRVDIFPAKRMPYENLELCVPKEVDSWLTGLYGDYMSIPPEEKRERHVVYEFDLGPYASLLQESGA